MVPITFKRLEHGEGLDMPNYPTPTSVGMSIQSAEPFKLFHGQTVLLKTGFAVDVPEGYELQLRSRNDLVAKHGIFVTGGILTIEGGEIRVPVSSLSRYAYQIARGDVIAQLVLCPVVRCRAGV